MKPELERIAIPGEHEARARAWSVVARAFDARQPARPRPTWPRVAAIAVAVAAVAAAALSSPGRAVLDEVREVVGVERAQPALFSLPAPGRLLVASDAGLWVVQQDGSKRLLGPYREGSWSPFGRFVVAARENELAALEPDGRRPLDAGTSRRSLPSLGRDRDRHEDRLRRPHAACESWQATGRRPLLVARRAGPIAWRPRRGFVLAYADRGGEICLSTRDAGSRWRRRRDGRSSSWSGRRTADGSSLVASTHGTTSMSTRERRPLHWPRSLVHR